MSITTDSFELMLLSAVVNDTQVYRKTVGLIENSMFSSSMSVEVYEIVSSFFKEYDRVPNREELLHLYKRDRIIDDDKPLVSFLDRIYNLDVDLKFVTKELNRYVKNRKLENLMKSSYEKIKLGQDIEVSNVVSDMFRVQMASMKDENIYGVSIDDADHLLEQDLKRIPIPTNIKELNEKLNGGLSGGQLGVVLAPPNYGKTMTLLNFALFPYFKKFNVLFVTLEMKEFSILRRIMMIMSGALKVNATMDTVRAVSKANGNKFIILYKPVKSITVDYLYSAFHQAEADGIKFDLVVIDYADLLTASRSYKEKRFELSDIFDSLKSFAQMLDIPVWTATQANRAGMRAETVTMEHMSEDISKAFISDVILSLNDKIQVATTTKFFLTKHREGQSDVYIDAYVNEKMWFEPTTSVRVDLSKI